MENNVKICQRKPEFRDYAMDTVANYAKINAETSEKSYEKIVATEAKKIVKRIEK